MNLGIDDGDIDADEKDETDDDESLAVDDDRLILVRYPSWAIDCCCWACPDSLAVSSKPDSKPSENNSTTINNKNNVCARSWKSLSLDDW